MSYFSIVSSLYLSCIRFHELFLCCQFTLFVLNTCSWVISLWAVHSTCLVYVFMSYFSVVSSLNLSCIRVHELFLCSQFTLLVLYTCSWVISLWSVHFTCLEYVFMSYFSVVSSLYLSCIRVHKLFLCSQFTLLVLYTCSWVISLWSVHFTCLVYVFMRFSHHYLILKWCIHLGRSFLLELQTT